MSGANCNDGCASCLTCRGEVRPDSPAMRDMRFALAMARGPLYEDHFLGPLGVAQTVRDAIRERGTESPEDTRVLKFVDYVTQRALGSYPSPLPLANPSALMGNARASNDALLAPDATRQSAFALAMMAGAGAFPPILVRDGDAAPQPGVAVSKLDEPGVDQTKKLCCCPTDLKIVGGGPGGSFALPRPDPPMMRSTEPVQGHKFTVVYTYTERLYRDIEPCSVSWNEFSTNRKQAWVPNSLGGWTAAELPASQWHDMALVNPYSGAFDDPRADFGVGPFSGLPARPPTVDHSGDPTGEEYTGRMTDNPGIFDYAYPDKSDKNPSRDLEGEVTLHPGCTDCPTLTVRFRQSARRRDGKSERNWFTYTGDTPSATGPGTAYDASVDASNPAEKAEYEQWRRDTHQAWDAGRPVYPK